VNPLIFEVLDFSPMRSNSLSALHLPAGRLQVIGEVGAQYEGIPPNDPRMEPLFAIAEELDVPHLRSTFGASYDAYYRSVHRWLPRVH
jgi:hypothetical protein